MGLLDGLKAMFSRPQKPTRPAGGNGGAGNGGTGSSGSTTPPDVIARQILTQMKAIYTRPMPGGGNGIHVETLLSALGAMAGFGSQVAVRLGIKAGLIPPAGALVEAKTKDGSVYYFGDQINQPLLEAPMSVWAHIGGAVQKLGKPLPDVMAMVRHVAASVGDETFGRLNVPEDHQPHELPIEALRANWQPLYTLVRLHSSEPLWTGWYFAMAAQFLILEAAEVIDATLAGAIAMESAVFMSKIDPKSIGFEI